MVRVIFWRKMKNYIFLFVYMVIMAAGLLYCNYGLGTAYDSPEFSAKFLPVMIILAVMVLIYAIKNKKDLAVNTDNKKGYLWFLLIFIPLLGMGIYSVIKNFGLRAEFFVVLFDSFLIGIAEEGMYRGILMGGLLRKLRPIAAIIISAVLFSLLHFLNILGGVGLSDVSNQMISTFFMGLFLGSAYLYTKNIWFPILFHFIWDYIILSGAVAGSSIMTVTVFGITGFELVISAILLFKFRKISSPVPK